MMIMMRLNFFNVGELFQEKVSFKHWALGLDSRQLSKQVAPKLADSPDVIVEQHEVEELVHSIGVDYMFRFVGF